MEENGEMKFHIETLNTMRAKYKGNTRPKRSNSLYCSYQKVYKLDQKRQKRQKRSNSLPTNFGNGHKNFSESGFNKCSSLYYGCYNDINDQVLRASHMINPINPDYLSFNDNVDISLCVDNLSITSHVENSIARGGNALEQLALNQEFSMNDMYNTIELNTSALQLFYQNGVFII
ncbi:8312_t:CDS:2 [Dentiscutata erythropus]|uniref:8312_t:CDS:1 n=1 Tax=Dentiscutata erythropus TaxID=1348616 RepID=A0A9N9N5L4_9GLOM|nr:8312_t:CDS:2 [Dentiscutata erythropus]